MAQAWCCLSCWRGMSGGDLSTTAHPQYFTIIIRAPESDSRLHTQMLVLSCFMVLPVPPLLHQNKDQQGQQIRLRITERCKGWTVFFPPTSFLPPWVRYGEPEVLFGRVIVTGMLQLFGGWNAGSIRALGGEIITRALISLLRCERLQNELQTRRLKSGFWY